MKNIARAALDPGENSDAAAESGVIFEGPAGGVGRGPGVDVGMGGGAAVVDGEGTGAALKMSTTLYEEVASAPPAKIALPRFGSDVAARPLRATLSIAVLHAPAVALNMSTALDGELRVVPPAKIAIPRFGSLLL